ncbi:MAG TPA: endonuclease/exonuclease/phosphatase family protein [Microvirga sp.]|jgi:endonuclease/exonuclease/phosphatase family metal-dependent hydrolase|nr:endonuclease/exonuclease/phosphatase family protein [Microvirga sp.]
MRLRICTFNVENLASRHRFGPKERPETGPALSLFDVQEPEKREVVERSVAVALEDDKRELCGLAIAETRADLLILQEIDNLGVLQPFFANYVHRLSDIAYGHYRLIDGNDPRGIDVAFAARLSLFDNKKQVRARSHQERTFGELGVHTDELAEFGIKPEDLIFNRDCLEVTLDLNGTELVLYICHFKAIADRENGRRMTRPIRQAEAGAVRRIIEERFGEGWRGANWIIAGDLNDFRERIRPGGVAEPARPSGIDVLFEDFATNPLDALPPEERWTFHFRQLLDDGSVDEQHTQLDYILLSPALAAANPTPKVELLRRGLPYRVPLDSSHLNRSIGYLATRADRYPRVGWDRPKASDHCPLVIEIDIPETQTGDASGPAASASTP